MLEVLLGDGRQLVGRAGDVQALARGDVAADLDLGFDLGLPYADRANAQAHGAVGEVQHLARLDRGGQPGPRDRHTKGGSGAIAVAALERHAVARLELDRVLGERADAQLRPRQVLQDGDRSAGAARRLADPLRRLRVLLVRAVAEVQPGDVHPGFDHPHEHLAIARGGADRGDDLRAAFHATNGSP